MMLFNYVLWNHSEVGQRSLEDVIGIQGHQLRALGYQAIWVPGSTKFIGPADGINVVVEGFSRAVIDDIARCHAEGARFMYLCTETPTPEGFNHGKPDGMRQRQDMFPEAAQYAEAALYLPPDEYSAHWYSQFKRKDGTPLPAAHCKLGWTPTLVGQTNPKPKFDVGFYGTLSQRRLDILKRLAKRLKTQNAVRLVPDFKTQAERDAIMRDCGVMVQLRKFDDITQPFSDCRAVMSVGLLGLPMVAEPHANLGPWASIVHVSKSLEDFYRDVIKVRNLHGVYRSVQYNKMKEKLPPDVCLGQPLRAVGLEERLRRAA